VLPFQVQVPPRSPWPSTPN